ncbi:MAG: HD domain-containing protein [Nitrospirae bacterium]|nr:HD domain-containing protein [Nitrospirota bacterium]
MVTKVTEIEGPYATIPLRQLIVGTRLPCDIFIKENRLLKVFLNRGMLYAIISKELLTEKGISNVYIHTRDIPDFEFYISRHRSSLQTDDDAGSTAEFKKYSYNKERFHQIDPALIKPGGKINFGLFLRDGLNFHPVVEATDDMPAEVGEGMPGDSGDMVIKRSDLHRYHEYISALPELESSESNKPGIKTLVLKEMTKIALHDFFDDPKSGKKIKKIHALVNEIIGSISGNRDAICTLLSLKGHDYYTYAHSVNVAVLSIGLGTAIGMKTGDLEKLGLGAILHDIGKIAISHEILNRQGRLNDMEFNIFKNHVSEGEKLMRSHEGFPDESLVALLQHHEKLSGKGYPGGLSGSRIELFGRISAIADYYDVLTTERLYKIAYKPFQALQKMSGETAHYDPELLKTFIKILGNIK